MQMGQSGKDYVEKEYTWEMTAKNYRVFKSKGFSKEEFLA